MWRRLNLHLSRLVLRLEPHPSVRKRDVEVDAIVQWEEGVWKRCCPRLRGERGVGQNPRELDLVEVELLRTGAEALGSAPPAHSPSPHWSTLLLALLAPFPLPSPSYAPHHHPVPARLPRGAQVELEAHIHRR